jgi:beta-lactamase regulating signal transducer with metallopeptidase domain
MSHLIASLAWCWVQVFLVAAAATVLSLLALRRSPAAGATIAWSGIVAALTLTGLAIVPLPVVPIVLGNLVISDSDRKQTGTPKPKLRFQAEGEETIESGVRAALNVPLLAKLLKSLRSSESAVVHHHGATRWALLALAIGSAIGLFRLVSGLVAIAALRRRSKVVSDNGASNLIVELLPQLWMRHLPQLRETNELDSAAVIGWWRPVVMLPANWREWSKGEMKAVLAHELAHIARHDAPWRLVAASVVALHWGQPFVHWLRR